MRLVPDLPCKSDAASAGEAASNGFLPPPVGVVIVLDHPAQHFTRGLQLLAKEPGLSVQVCYWSADKGFYDACFNREVSWDVDLLAGYRWAAPPPSASSYGRLRWLVRQLRAVRPDVIMCYGWKYPIARASIIYSVFARTRLLLYGDSTWQHLGRSRYRPIKSIGLRILTRLCAGAISTGTFNREFYIRFGMDPEKIWPGVCPADTEVFRQVRNSRENAGNFVGRELRIGFAGKLIPRKGVDDLLYAASMLPADRPWSLTIIGDGPLMVKLKMLSTDLELGERVTFSGFRNVSEMPKLLADFDVVVVPSRVDMRVLVTIEAMAAGAAVVVSDATAVWGPGDLIEDGVSGLVYRSGDASALAAKLCRLMNESTLLGSLRHNGMARVLKFGPDAFAKTAAIALRQAAAPARKRAVRHYRDE